jgi:UTP-glucose-1-phosphate uridylyltransferase
LDFVLDEAFAAGAVRAVVVSSRIKSDVAHIVSGRPEHIDLRYQDQPLGLAHAIVAAQEIEEDALILLPDTVFAVGAPAAGLASLRPCPDAAILTETIEDVLVPTYGIVECEGCRASKILEKPRPDETSSRLAVAARYFLSDRVLRLLRECVEAPTASGEWDLTSALNRAILHRMHISVVITDVRRFDCGSPEGYRAAREFFER